MKMWMKLALVGLLAFGATELVLRRRAPPRAAGGEPAPEFSLADTGGRTVSLAGLRGRVVAVNFWATWCGPCQEEIPDLAKVYASHRGGCFELLGVAEESSPGDVAEVSRKLGVNYPVLLDGDGKVGDAFRIPAYPRTFLIDAGGRVRKLFEGQVDAAELERELSPLLAEAPASCRS
jgi:cytochrome c biogenesis protein CcmG, thiol:disulfide interchange protein DsbE